jgi:hypothetical protein
MPNWKTWLLGIAAAGIAGGANGVITGFAAVGIDPQHFNLQSGLHSTLMIAGVSALMSSIIGVAAYLKQSPLPGENESNSHPFPHEDHDPHFRG